METRSGREKLRRKTATSPDENPVKRDRKKKKPKKTNQKQYEKLLMKLSCLFRTGKYLSSVFFAQTKLIRCSVCTKFHENLRKYFPVWTFFFSLPVRNLRQIPSLMDLLLRFSICTKILGKYFPVRTSLLHLFICTKI